MSLANQARINHLKAHVTDAGEVQMFLGGYSPYEQSRLFLHRTSRPLARRLT